MIAYFKELQCYARLKSSPLFNLSLSSKELFHSNFLAWVFENYEHETIVFFNNLAPMFQLEGPIKVEREKNHIDLTITFNDSYKILIENKVKSLPSQAQLDEYNRNLNREKEVLFLLSLYPFDYPHFISYQQIGDWLQNINVMPIELDNRDEGPMRRYYIIRDYIEFTRDLTTLVNFLSEEDVIFNFHSRSFFYGAFNELRLHDIFHKIKYSRLKDRISVKVTDWMKEEGLSKSENEDLFVPSDFYSKGAAAINLQVPIQLEKRTYFEIQMQDNMLRFMLRCDGCVKNQNKIKENPLFHDFFDPINLENSFSFEKPKMRNEFNKYWDCIMYKYVNIADGCNLEELINDIVGFVKQTIINVHKNKLKIREFLADIG